MPDLYLSVSLLIVILVLVLLFLPPGRGLLARLRQSRRLADRHRQEDALKRLQTLELQGKSGTLSSIAGSLELNRNQAAGIVAGLVSQELITQSGDRLKLTAQGREIALHILRAHRLLERQLAEETGFDESEWHRLADRQEHLLSAEEADAIALRLNQPTHDPHGDPIPTADGQVVPHGGQPLNTLGVDQQARIVHIEDEPEAIAAQLQAERLYPGMILQMLENSTQRVRFWGNGGEHLLAPIVAANIAVVPVEPHVASEWVSERTLGQLRPGQTGRVLRISPRCRGLERRRMMDLGILPGTEITAEFASPARDPVAYRIRDAVIALRNEQAQQILIDPEPEDRAA
jgi:DtxR family Mn-dependent transcriptional regulator